MRKMILQHNLNIQHSKGDKLVKSILITGLLLCLAVFTLHGKGQAQSQVEEAAILNEQARQYLDQGKYDEAEPLLKRALAIREKALGPDHPDTAQSLNNLALIYQAQEKYAEAEPLYKRAIAIREKAQGYKHPDLVLVLTNYADLLRKMSRGDEAARLEARVAEIRASPDPKMSN
jgi:tetratricopeptide (TPR) repeat protein